MYVFDSSTEHYSIYLDREGEEFYIAHGFPRRFLVMLDDDWDWMRAKWINFRRAHEHFRCGVTSTMQMDFREFFAALITEPDIADDIHWCECCDSVYGEEEGESTKDSWACRSCIEHHYFWCEGCSETVTSDDSSWTLHENRVCDGCISRSYNYCDECDGYYHNSYDDHNHDGSGCCEPVATSFSVRNDGDGPLANDTIVTVSLPAGVIDDVGLARIQEHLQANGHWNVSRIVNEVGPLWQAKRGTFTKRLSREAHVQFAEKLSPAVLSEIGNIARAHSTSVDFRMAVTRELNMSAEYFYHEGSCWWTTHFHSRCALKSNGGFGLRTFGENEWDVHGRAWVMPLKEALDHHGNATLLPTFETMEPDAFVVFNCYGDLEGYAAARIVSHMAGMTYRKIDFRCSPMYVNEAGDSSSAGYIVAPEAIAMRYTDGSLILAAEQHSNLFNSEAAEAAAAARLATQELVHA